MNKNHPVGSPPVATSHDKSLNRKYPRATFHDYNGGTYFVTVCTKDKKHYFGKISGNEMHLSALGQSLHDNLGNIATHYPDVEIPLYVVMPNHFHAIIIVGSPPVATNAKLSTNLGRLNQLARITVATGGDPTYTTHHNNRLGNVVAGIKANITRFARRNDIEFGWQPRYHDHIIRGIRDGNLIAEYIENNIFRWTSDCFYEK